MTSAIVPDADSITRRLPPVVSSGDRRLRYQQDWHRAMLAVTIVILLFSIVLTVRDDQRVALPGLADFPFPQTCGMRLIFGLDCPACGLTRSFIYLAHGDWRSSLSVHRIGWLVALLFVLQGPYRVIALRSPAFTLSPVWAWIIGVTIAGLLFVNWLYNLVHSVSG